MKTEYLFGGIILVLLIIIGALLLRTQGDTAEDPNVVEQRNADADNSQPDNSTGNENQNTDEDDSGNSGVLADVLDGKIPLPLPTKLPDLPDADSLPDVEPKEVIGGLVDIFNEGTKLVDETVQDAMALTLDEEKEWGRRLHAAICKENNISNNARIKNRIESLGKPLLKYRKRKSIDYTFTVIDDPAINAFALAGGYVYVNRGLIDFAKTDEELAFVIGHEIGHVDLGHTVKKLTYYVRASEVASPLAGDLVSFAHRMVSSGYTKNNEFEADEWSMRILTKEGLSRNQLISFHRRLRQHMIEQGHEVENVDEPTTIFEVMRRKVDGHFHSHPPTKERIERLENLNLDR